MHKEKGRGCLDFVLWDVSASLSTVLSISTGSQLKALDSLINEVGCFFFLIEVIIERVSQIYLILLPASNFIESLNTCWTYALSLLIVAKDKIQQNFQISFWKMLKNKQYHVKVDLYCWRGFIEYFILILKSQTHLFKTSSLTLQVKGFCNVQ